MKTNTFPGALGVAALVITLMGTTGTERREMNQGSVVAQTQQSVRTSTSQTQKWEYRIIRHVDIIRLDNEANRLGEQGFDIVAFQVIPQRVDQLTGDPMSAGLVYVTVFRRPKS